MFWPLWLILKLGMRMRLIVFSFFAGLAAALLVQLREEQRTWGVLPKDAARDLPGDELIVAADVSETRSLSIAAAPDAVWPWLVQMGWGRGGWYSYDKMDMDGSSAEGILAEFQDLAVGDMVPTHPGGGFVARIVEPERALVLYLDSELVNSELEAAGDEVEAAIGDESTPVGMDAAGALGNLAMSDFRATWAFVLEPEPDGTTRLVERMRFWTGEGGLPQRLGMPFMGLGVFVMTRKHMLGVKERAERMAAGADEATPVSDRTEA